ncbi:MAG: carbohydrate binding domain-containing protein [Candidatus Aerophobetes bacterium]|nr:carbohydrate binding domain-containing protein [Candidatus Aerophobetes bacterium]
MSSKTKKCRKIVVIFSVSFLLFLSFKNVNATQKEIYPFQISLEEESKSLPEEETITDQNSWQSEVKIIGRKLIELKYGKTHYLNPDEASIKENPSSQTEVNQELQLGARGRIGNKIFVDISYDDTVPLVEQRKISLNYEGEKREIVKEALLGDIKLDLPRSEFVAYNKSLFGAKIEMREGNFSLTGIGSVIKGISESKTFTGKKIFKKKEIPDTAYVKGRYYKLYFDSHHLPLAPGSAEVYIDDGDGTNNGSAIWMKVTGEDGDTYEGYFDEEYPGEDYLFDSDEGIIKFEKEIKDNYIIAGAYKDKNGTRCPETGYRMIKKGQDVYYDKYEFKNYYSLGLKKIQREDFVLRILDLSDNILFDLSNPEVSEYEVEVDYDFGIVKITKPFSSEPDRPFPEAYPPRRIHRYTIYTEYEGSIDTYILKPDIIPASERVYLNGKLLKRDVDYVIDYPSGFLTFVYPGRIPEDTKIKVDYEWMPFAGGKATILGARLGFSAGERFSAGSTFLSRNSFSVKEVPSLESPPSSDEVIGLDTHFDFSPHLVFQNKEVPLNLTVSGEIAQGRYNPNTFGRAMVEDFESTKVIDELSMDKDDWQIGSKPEDVSEDKRDYIVISDEEIPGDEINPEWSREKRRVLLLDYDFPSSQYWDSVVYSVSSTGVDLSQRDYLELWVKGDGGGETLHLDLGVVNEDADGDGKLDTEDRNGDGKLNPGEDTGIEIGGRHIGEGNGRLDTEDLDGDGRLNSALNIKYTSYSRVIYSDWTGWRKLDIPLNEGVSPFPWDEVSSLVKHLRVWIEGDNFSGTLKFAFMGIAGDRWESHNLETKAINNKDNPEYNPFTDDNFRDYYERMYGKSETSEGKWRKEGAFSLIYNLSPQEKGWVQQTYIKPRDFSYYRNLNFWIYGDKNGEEVSLRIGSDVEEGGNYYTLQSKIDYKGWRLITVPLQNLTSYGNPSFDDIKQLRIEVENDSNKILEGKIYANDIFLSEVIKSKGLAKRVALQIDSGDSFSVDTEYKKMDPAFHTIGVPFKTQGSELSRIGAKLSLSEALPLFFNWRKEEKNTLSTRGTDLSSLELGKAIEEVKDYEVNLLFPTWPEVVLRKKNSITDYELRKKRKIEDAYEALFKYENPYSSSLPPSSIETRYQLIDREDIDSEGVQKREEIRKFRINLPFNPLENLSINPTYSQNIIDQKKNEGKMPKLKEEKLSLISKVSFLNLSPEINFDGGYKEDGFSLSDYNKRDVYTHSQTSLSLPLRIKTFFPEPKLFNTLRFYFNYKVERENIYEDTVTPLSPLSQLGLKRVDLEDGRTKLALQRKNFSIKESWEPLDFLDVGSDYSRLKEKKIRVSTPYILEVESWPNITLKFDLLKTPFLDEFSSKLFNSSFLTLEYVRKTTDKENISHRIVYQPSLTLKGILKKPSDFTLTLNYTSTRGREEYYERERILRDFSESYTLKADYYVLFPWKIRIPIFNWKIDFKDRVHFSSGVNLNTEKKYYSPGRVDEDNIKYTLFTDTEYRIQKNLSIKLGIEGSYVEDKVDISKSCYSYGASASLELRF